MVTVDPLTDAIATGVGVGWETSPRLADCARHAAMRGQTQEPAFTHSIAVLDAMLAAITAILTSAGFTVRESLNDYAPFTLDVVDAPPTGPSWERREGELAWPALPSGEAAVGTAQT
ncbi:hypothetical protein ACIA8O_37065 [Kitasatospora sp. NPDC051853]|uniref:hypothetical protein n=1 Tax=Kitasatospora sp. NPDC051853 TaxID=3364058 RepID=UPI0037B86C24